MRRRFLFAKIQGLRVTEVKPDYDGSLGLDGELLEQSGIKPYEVVQVINQTTGARFETYVIPLERGSGRVGLYGGAARLGQPGDALIVLCEAEMDEEEADGFRPRLVFCGEGNRPQ